MFDLSAPRPRGHLREIRELTQRMTDFWTSCRGWAPAEAAELLAKSRLDRFNGLTKCLSLWSRPSGLPDREGALILAWTNLGALVECALKLYLAVFLKNYQADPVRDQRGQAIELDRLTLEHLRQFLHRVDLLSPKSRKFIGDVQQRRNAVHSFRDRDIATFERFRRDLLEYLELLHEIDAHLPYP